MFSKNTYFSCFLLWLLLRISLYNILGDIFLVFIFLFFLGIILFLCFIQNRHTYVCLFFVFFASLFWSIYGQFYIYKVDKNIEVVDRYMWTSNTYIGEVKNLYKKWDFQDQYVLTLKQIWNIKVSGNILHILKIPKNFSLYPWQSISYQGKMYPLKDFNGFKYKKYMLSKGIYFSTSSSIVDNLVEGKKWWRYKFFSIREKLLSTIWTIFPQEEAIFLWGILFGARENIPSDLKKILIIQGLHTL